MSKFNVSNGNVADLLKGGLALYDVAKAANAKPEEVDPRLADYNKADNMLYSQNVDLTAANNQSQAAANQGVSQINDASMSNSVRMSRLQGVNANFQENAGKLSLQAQGMKNAINQNLGQYEGNKAVDNANRLTASDEKFAMNKAATRSAAESAKQTLGSLAQDFVAKQNQKDAWNQAIQSAKFKGAEGMSLLKATVNNFQMDASKEWSDYVSNPNDINLEKLTQAMKIKFK
jgi:FlaG/FlaF family flagellin (archaellin)